MRKIRAGTPFSIRCARTGVSREPLQRYPIPKKIPIMKSSTEF
jgi:hypothetical protein